MNLKTFLSLAVLCLSFSSAFAQEKSDKKQEAAKPEMLEMAGGKIVAAKPEAWKTMPKKSEMIQYEFRAPAEGEKSARVTIMSAGGSTESNIERWIGQFDGGKKEDAKIEKKEVDQTTISIVEMAGTFKESMGGPAAPMKKMENYKMLGAILELNVGSKVFIKATGPSDIVTGMREGFVKMLEGIKNK